MNASTTDILSLPLSGKHIRILAVASMEQIIGAALSTVAGVMIPMINLVAHPELSSFVQGILGCAGLIGIAIGASVIGSLSDRQGYLKWFRICPAIITLAALLVWLTDSVACTIGGLFLIGLGVGGGYSLDSSYISELMPTKWKLIMVGIAKGTSALGFTLSALACYIILIYKPDPAIWNYMILVVAVLGLITCLLRIHFAESPMWLLEHGENAKAEKAAEFFFGPEGSVSPSDVPAPSGEKASFASLFKGKNLAKVIYGGIPWACEGVGVYGVGVFLPMLLMALGIESESTHGIHKIMNSVELTAVINFFIIPGFIIGLLLMKKVYHPRLMATGFFTCSAGLVLLLAAYLMHWPMWVSVGAFIIFEIALNAGPHLITFIIPSQIFPIDERSTGSGISATIGKIGAILGVFFMPLLLKWGGITLVLIVCIGVELVGGLITVIMAKKVMPEPQSTAKRTS